MVRWQARQLHLVGLVEVHLRPRHNGLVQPVENDQLEDPIVHVPPDLLVVHDRDRTIGYLNRARSACCRRPQTSVGEFVS